MVIGQDVSELLFFDQYAKLLKRMKELEISVATGCVCGKKLVQIYLKLYKKRSKDV